MAPPWLSRSPTYPLLTVLLASTAACDTLLAPTAPDPDGLAERTAELERRWPAETPTASALLANLEATGWTDAEVAATLTCADAGTLGVRINPVTGSMTAILRHDLTHPAVITGLSLERAPLTDAIGVTTASSTTTASTGSAALAGSTNLAGSALTVRIPTTLTAGRPLAGALRVEAAGAEATTWALSYAVPTRETALAHAWWERTGAEVEELDELIKEFGWLVDEAERAPLSSSSTAFLAAFDRLKIRRAQLAGAAPPWPAITLGCPVAAPSAR